MIDILKSAREERASLVEELDQILTDAETEKRELQEAEETRYNDAEKEISELDKKIERLEKQEERKAELAKQAKEAAKAAGSELPDHEARDLNKLGKDFDRNVLARFLAGEGELSGALKEANEEARGEISGNKCEVEYKRDSFVIPGKMIRAEWERQSKAEKRATVDQANSAIQPTMVADYVDGIRQSSIYSRVIPSGNIFQGLTADVKIPAVGAHNLAWEGENSSANDIGAQFTKDTLSPVRLSGYVPISRRLLLQNGEIAMNVIMRDLARSESNKIDASLFATADVTGAIPSIAGTSGVLTITEAATYAAPSSTVRGTLYDDLLAGVQKLADGDVQATAIVHNTKVMSDLLQSPQVINVSGAVASLMADGVYVVNINGIPVYLTTSTTSSGTTSADFVGGDFNYAFVGFFGGVEIMVDPYSGSKEYEDHVVYHRHLDSSAIRGAGFVKATSLLS